MSAAAASAADGLELRQLQVVHRHGDRTPITPLTTAHFGKALPSDDERIHLAVGTHVKGNDGVPHPAAGDGVFGTLTARGLQQMRQGGPS